MERARIFVVDDKENMLKLEFDLVVTDLGMPGVDRFEVPRTVKSRAPDTEAIMMTAYASVQDAVDAMKQGAYDYLQKPFDPDDALLVVARALERRRLRVQTRSSGASSTGSARMTSRSGDG
ncbi:response regulator [Anaeromyxobacter oryzae]|uniref:Response regulatory domain-containing protein n=1 Tax=Anaeromyxobacter oryzae TaxID=2918170 RepID=A0ABM7WSE9_9BACT|nr:response regulator [Anaeromyxobacter oryzae]BDG02407.1 hypothetical protein AMOR_14030 [Anaeromyxobacter oryzae]